MSLLGRCIACTVMLSFGLISAAGARAEVQVSGGADHIVLRARNATMAEVLSGIHSAVNISIVVTGSTSRQFTGTYEGSLRRVLVRLLGDENYVIKSDAVGIDIVIVGSRRGSEQPVPLALSAPLESNAVQGWSGSATLKNATALATKPAPVPSDPAAPLPSLTATSGDADNPVQGWAAAGNPFKIATTGDIPAALRWTANAQATAAVDYSATEQSAIAANVSEAVNPVQGWAPSGNPFKTESANVMPSVAEDQAASTVAEEDGSNLQGYDPAAALRTRATRAGGAADAPGAIQGPR